jgi:hypothetical protein
MKSEPKPESRRSTYVSQRSLLQRDKTPRPPAYTIQSSKRVRRRGTNWSESHFSPRQSRISAASATQTDKKELCSTDLDRSMPCCKAGGSITEIGICCRCAITCEARSTIISSPGGTKPAHCVVSGGSAQVHQSAVPAFAQATPQRVYITTNSGTQSCLADASASSLARYKRQKLSTKRARAFACPFYKYDPTRYSPHNADTQLARRFRTCSGPGWDSTHRLKEHLTRAHDNELELAPSMVRQELKRKSRGSTEEERWTSIFLMVSFPCRVVSRVISLVLQDTNVPLACFLVAFTKFDEQRRRRTLYNFPVLFLRLLCIYSVLYNYSLLLNVLPRTCLLGAGCFLQ